MIFLSLAKVKRIKNLTVRRRDRAIEQMVEWTVREGEIEQLNNGRMDKHYY